MTCDRIRFGGTISGSTLSGGTLVESQAIALTTWSGLLGHPGYRGTNSVTLGRDGSSHRAKPYRERMFTLSVAAWNRDSVGTITAPGGKCEELDDNQDTLLGLIDGNGGQFIIEQDMTDGTTRWIRAEVSAGAYYVDGPVFGESFAARTLFVPLVSAYPFWQSETLNSDTLSGSDSLVNAGNGRISNAVLTFAGDGTLTNSDNGQTLTVAGSSAAVTVDVYAQTVTMSGSPADNVLTPGDSQWMTFSAGTTSVTTTVSVGVSYRDHWI